MIVHKITPIVNQTAQLLNKDPELVAHVIGHILYQIKEYIENPNSPGIRITNFGVIRPYQPALTKHLKRLLTKLRDPNTPPELIPEYQTQFRIFWNLRKLNQQDNERRKFKKRFGN